MFLPASGDCYFAGEAIWEGGGYYGGYWSCKQDDENDAYFLSFNDEGGINVSNYDESDYYYSCRLVRE